MSNFFKKLFKPSEHSTDNGPSSISGPMMVKHNFHVERNQTTGALEGLPDAWLKVVTRELTEDEVKENPDAVIQAVKYYMWGNNHVAHHMFKPITTAAKIQQESEEIDNIMEVQLQRLQLCLLVLP